LQAGAARELLARRLVSNEPSLLVSSTACEDIAACLPSHWPRSLNPVPQVPERRTCAVKRRTILSYTPTARRITYRSLLMVARAAGRCTLTATSWPVARTRARYTCTHRQRKEEGGW